MNKIFIALMLIVFMTVPITSVCSAENYYNIMDENGAIVYTTGWKIKVGDQFLTENNKRYEIVSVEHNTARAKLIGSIDLSSYVPQSVTNNQYFGLLRFPVTYAQGNGKVAVYHTHSDESYVPSDGKESIYGNGGIYKVGDAFTSALQGKGVDVVHSDARHDPHDDMAYERSRRTVTDLLKQKPDAVFDVHRDSVPPEVYHTNVNGQNLTKVQLVVGKYGPTGKQIEDYALQVKAAADGMHPGLVKGIFFAKGGDYNQDLHPRSLLLEVGAHTNDRAEAEKGIALFADIVPTILGKSANTTDGSAGLGTTTSGASGASKSLGWIIGLSVLGVAGFLFLSTGSFKEAGSKLKQFTSSEFANFFSPKNKENEQDNKDKDGQK